MGHCLLSSTVAFMSALKNNKKKHLLDQSFVRRISAEQALVIAGCLFEQIMSVVIRDKCKIRANHPDLRVADGVH